MTIEEIRQDDLANEVCEKLLRGVSDDDDFVNTHLQAVKDRIYDTNRQDNKLVVLRCAHDGCESTRHNNWRVCIEHGQTDFDQDGQRDINKDNEE